MLAEFLPVPVPCCTGATASQPPPPMRGRGVVRRRVSAVLAAALVASLVVLVHDAPRPAAAQETPVSPPVVDVELVALGHVTDTVRTYLDRPLDVTVLTHEGKRFAAVVSDAQGPHLLDITDPRNIDPLNLANTRDANIDYGINNINSASGAVAINNYRDSDGRPHFIVGWGGSGAIQAMKIRQSTDTLHENADASQVGRLMRANFAVSQLVNDAFQNINDMFIYSIGAKQYAVTVSGARKNLVIADVTDPNDLSSAIVGSIVDNDSTVLNNPDGVAYYKRGDKHYAVVTSTGTPQGIQIVDVSDPANPTAADSPSDNGELLLRDSSGVDVWTVRGRSYAAVVTRRDDGLQIVDVTDPDNIFAAGQLKNNSKVLLNHPRNMKVMAIEDRFYAAVAADETEDGVSLIDVTDPYRPFGAATISDGQNGASELDGANGIDTFSADGRHFIVVTAREDHGVQILEVKTRPNTGVLDPAFGHGGVTSAAFGASESEVFDVVEQRDGKVVAVGYAAGNYKECDNTPSSTKDFALVRYNVDGSLDASFGVGGRVLTNFTVPGSHCGLDDEARAVALQSDNKIVVAGYAAVPNRGREFVVGALQLRRVVGHWFRDGLCRQQAGVRDP